MSHIFNEKKTNTDYLYVESSHNETILNKTFLTEGIDRSRPRGLRLNV